MLLCHDTLCHWILLTLVITFSNFFLNLKRFLRLLRKLETHYLGNKYLEIIFFIQACKENVSTFFVFRFCVIMVLIMLRGTVRGDSQREYRRAPWVVLRKVILRAPMVRARVPGTGCSAWTEAQWSNFPFGCPKVNLKNIT